MKSRRKAPTPECEKIKLDTKVQEEGFGEILKESTYARAGSARIKEVKECGWLQLNKKKL